MSLEISDFDDFFTEVNGNPPFPWQRRLLNAVAQTGQWPEVIAAPTGAGKTSVIDIHLFLVALSAVGAGPRVPRRLAHIVGRRGLVDNNTDHALHILDTLRAAGPGSLLARIAEALASLRTSDPTPSDAFTVAEIRGGMTPDTTWRDDPTACTILCATPDMWGSRILFRGYGTSRLSRPREAGLLACDSVMVLDEAHLNRQLLVTARRITFLHNLAPHTLGVPGLQVVETTATPDTQHQNVVTLDGADHDDPVLAPRLTTPKPVQLVRSPQWPPARAGSRRTALVTEFADIINTLHTENGRGSESGRTIGCVVNTVALAVDIHDAVIKQGLRAQLLVGRMRPHDLETMRANHPGLLTTDGADDIDVLIATQTIEVGVDIDLSALVTEIAPGTAIAQRAGRVNRLGRSTTAPIVVVGPSDDDSLPESVPPYSGTDVEQAWRWLEKRAADARGLAPVALSDDPAPAEQSRRPLFQRLELADSHFLSRTNDDLFAEPDLDLWLRDDLTPERATAGVVSRSGLPHNSTEALALLRATPPVDAEIYPASLHLVRALARNILAKAGDENSPFARGFVQRADELSEIANDSDIRSGDILVIDDVHTAVISGVIVENPTSEPTDVFDAAQDTTFRILPTHAANRKTLSAIADWIVSNEDEPFGPSELAALLQGTHPNVAQWLIESPNHVSFAHGDVTYDEANDESTLPWLAVTRPTAPDEETRQVWTRSTTPVLLADHNSDVGERAKTIAHTVGLNGDIVRVLELAGKHHDDGKTDSRFQTMLGNPDPSLPPLAKSHTRSRRDARTPPSSLPRHWRHEQLSASLAAPHIDQKSRDIVMRLIGTSHGHGRPGFPHTSAQLLNAQHLPEVHQIAGELWDNGTWDSLIDTTHRTFGIWGCAYLEALLRAADVQISSEGR